MIREGHIPTMASLEESGASPPPDARSLPPEMPPLLEDTDSFQSDLSVVDEANLSADERFELWKSKGMCVRCGLVRTHARPEDDAPELGTPLKPITVDDDVYKGYHLSCFGGRSLVMDLLGEHHTQTRGPSDHVNQADDAPSTLVQSFETISASDSEVQENSLQPLENGDLSDGASIAISTSKPPNYDKLTVFQAAPLVWRETCADKDGGCEFHPIEMLDFDREREVLEASFRDAREYGRGEVDVVFETATTERLGAFLAANESQVLHFTCHGAPQYLCMEDGVGGAHLLMNDELRELMSPAVTGREGDNAGDHNLRFVFVSACYSRAAGEAFIKAGVPHVVCCQQDEPIMDQATIEFSRSFYHALACGTNLQGAFRLARKCVQTSPYVPDAENEMRKFLLLPEGANHDVQIFFTNHRHRSMGSLDPPPSPWILPASPQVFLGRELEIYKVLCNLRTSRLVRLRGGRGSGKSSLAAAVANYISSRGRSLSVDEIVWLPLLHAGRVGNIGTSFQELYALLEDEWIVANFELNNQYQRVCASVFEYLHQRRVLIVFEMKSLIERHQVDNLSNFLQDLFRCTTYVRVLLVCQDGLEVVLHNSAVESEVMSQPLTFSKTATLFGRLCRHVSDRRHPKAWSPRQLADLLVPKDKGNVRLQSQKALLSQRCIDIFGRIGEGIPAKIHRAAKQMTAEQYDALLAVAERLEYSANCKTREELEQQLSQLNEDLQIAVREKSWSKARDIQAAFDELERLKESLPTVEELRRTAETLEQDVDRAADLKDFSSAEALSKQLDGIISQIKAEEEAHIDLGQDSKPSKDNRAERRREKISHSTRAGLETEIRTKREELERSITARDFASCNGIQKSIDELESRRESLPCRPELSSKISSLKAELDAAIQARDFATAESVHQRIQRLEEQLALEEESEDNFVSITAIWVGKLLVSFGEELDKAVRNKETARAKEIEHSILKEVKQLEWRFTLDYGHEGDQGNDADREAEDAQSERGNHDDGTEREAEHSRPRRDQHPGGRSAENNDEEHKQKEQAATAAGAVSRRRKAFGRAHEESQIGTTARAESQPSAPSVDDARWAQAQTRLRFARSASYAEAQSSAASVDDARPASAQGRVGRERGGSVDSWPGAESQASAPSVGDARSASAQTRLRHERGGSVASWPGSEQTFHFRHSQDQNRVGRSSFVQSLYDAQSKSQASYGNPRVDHFDHFAVEALPGADAEAGFGLGNDDAPLLSAASSGSLRVEDAIAGAQPGAYAVEGPGLSRHPADEEHPSSRSSLTLAPTAVHDGERPGAPLRSRSTMSSTAVQAFAAVTQEDDIERIVRDVIARDAVEATDIVAENASTRSPSRKPLFKAIGKLVNKFGKKKK